MSVIILTTGVPGCGKTYVRAVRFLVDDFLVNTSGKHYSNFPLNVDVISEDVSKKINKNRGFFGIFRKKVKPCDISSRLVVIDDNVLQSWRLGLSGPWDYFRGVDLKYAHIAIDEIHNFCSSRQSPECLQKWDEFLGEVRHRGCTFEGLTQDIDQVDRVLTGRASTRLELVPGEDMRDPFFKIKLADWYELKACFTGFFHKTVFMFEKRKQDSKWKTNHISRFLISPDYYKYYNSYNASLQEKASGDVSADRTPEHEYQKRGKISLLLWFVRRNFFTLFFRFLIAILVFWLLFCGGLTFIINSFVSSTVSLSKKQRGSAGSVVSDKKTDGFPGSVVSSVYIPSGSSDKASLEEKKYFDQKKEIFENGFKPGLFLSDSVYLRNGIRIHVGYSFNHKKYGEYCGKSVTSINRQDRNYTLSDGSVIDMY